MLKGYRTALNSNQRHFYILTKEDFTFFSQVKNIHGNLFASINKIFLVVQIRCFLSIASVLLLLKTVRISLSVKAQNKIFHQGEDCPPPRVHSEI